MFDIENIQISKCIEMKCPQCKQSKLKTINAYNELMYSEAWYCKLDVVERYYDCPLFRADVERITDIVRFEVKQVTYGSNGKVQKIGWHIFDNDYGHLVDVIDTFEFEDKDKIDKLCEWLNKLDDSYLYVKKE